MAKQKKNTIDKKKNTPRIVPLQDRVLVRPYSDEDLAKSTRSGIYIPDTVDKEKSQQGEVVAVGEGKYHDGKLVSVSVKPGDVVFFSKYGFDEIKVDDEELYLIKEENVLAVWRK